MNPPSPRPRAPIPSRLSAALPALMAACLCTVAHAQQATARIGDAGLQTPPEPQAAHYPQRQEWANAGVRPGLPLKLPPDTRRLAPGQSIQDAIDALNDGGTVILEPGEHRIDQPLRLRSNTLLTGADQAATILLYGLDATAPPTAIILDGIERAGVSALTIRHADPAQWASQPHAIGLNYANAPGYTPTGRAAIEISNATDCWLDQLTLQQPAESPLTLHASQHCTIRSFQVDRVLHRGSRAGSLTIANASHILLAGLSIGPIRRITLSGPVSHSVLTQSVLAAGLYLHRADHVRNNLIDDVHFLLPPAAFMPPLSKGPMPAGPRNLLINCTFYHHGLDGFYGSIPQPGEPYLIHPYAHRTVVDPVTLAPSEQRFASRLQALQTLGPAPAAPPPIVPLATEPRPEWTIFNLVSGASIDDWVFAGPFPTPAQPIDPASLATTVLVPGQPIDLFGSRLTPRLTRPVRTIQMPPIPDNPADAQARIARLGMQVYPLGSGRVDVLALADDDWSASLILQRLVHIREPAFLRPDQRAAGCTAVLMVGPNVVQPDQTLHLQPGLHLITAAITLVRNPPFAKQASYTLRFTLQPPPQPSESLRDVPRPQLGRLYPPAHEVDLIAAERPALQRIRTILKESMQDPDWPTGPQGLARLAADHPATIAASQANAILHILNNAPFKPADSLTPMQWAQLADYYAQAGLPQRKWLIDKHRKPPRFRQHYPDAIVQPPSAKDAKP